MKTILGIATHTTTVQTKMIKKAFAQKSSENSRWIHLPKRPRELLEFVITLPPYIKFNFAYSLYNDIHKMSTKNDDT